MQTSEMNPGPESENENSSREIEQMSELSRERSDPILYLFNVYYIQILCIFVSVCERVLVCVVMYFG